MPTVEKLDNSKLPITVLDRSLEQFGDKALFSKKLEKAKAILSKAGLPRF